MLVELLAIAQGPVQGVGFRALTQRLSTDLHLKGYVRNRADGTVEILAQGDRKELEKLLEKLIKHHPHHTQTIVYREPVHFYRDFSILC